MERIKELLEGRRPSLFTPRRLKSFKCFVFIVVAINGILFLSLFWSTTSDPPNIPNLQRGLLARTDFEAVSQTRDAVLLVKDKPELTPSEKSDVKISNETKKLLRAAAGNVAPPGYLAHGRAKSNVTIINDVQRSACSYRTAAYVNNRHIKLKQPPFSEYVDDMTCLEDGNIAVFSGKFARFNNMIVDPTKVDNRNKGGEKIETVWEQKESDEYFSLRPGYFKVSCSKEPKIKFSGNDHLSLWIQVLQCYRNNETDIKSMATVRHPTIAIQRYEYVNLYHTMTDFYNAFILMLLFGIPPSRLTILAVDAHPEGTLDEVWGTLFGKFLRAGHLEETTVFNSLAWGFMGYSSPLNHHERAKVPYLEEFREFFLTRHNVTMQHTKDCKNLNVVIIFRRDYVAHPRNPTGNVVRKFDNEEEIVRVTQETLGESANVKGLQLDALPMREQLDIIASCDILMGMHGAGLSHILFLPTTSGVVEFKPNYSNPTLTHFQSFAKWRNLPYTLWHNFEQINEKGSYKTKIPPETVKRTVTTVYSRICDTDR